METSILPGAVGIGQGVMVLTKKLTLTRCKERFFYNEGVETLAQRGGKCLIPGNLQGQVRWGCEQLDV